MFESYIMLFLYAFNIKKINKKICRSGNVYAAYKPVHPCDFFSVFIQEQKYPQVAMLTTQNQVELYNNNNNRRSRNATGIQTNWFLRGDYFINSAPHHKVMSKQQNKH